MKNNQASVSNADRETPTSFPALSVDSRVGISRSASETDDWLFFLPIIVNFYKSFVYYFLKRYVTAKVFVTARRHRL